MSSSEAEFSFRTRQKIIQNFKEKTPSFDSFIIGGGIVGTALSRELSIRGIHSCLVEQNDFASGTSSKSSKLIHGGLRYLEMMDFKLVFEALSERHWLLKSHPHLVSPLQFNLPVYDKEHAPPGQRPSWMLSLGLWLYDTLSLFRSPFFHGKHSKSESEKYFPGIKQSGLKSCLYYADAMMLDDELVLECAYDAFKRGSTLLNYTRVVNVSKKNSSGFYEISLEDSLNPKDKFKVLTKEVIVCVGPWTGHINNLIPGGSVKKLKPSKGVHLIFEKSRFPIEHCLVMYADDGRIVFAIPRNDLGKGEEKIIVGTTDSAEGHDPSHVFADELDLKYILNVLGKYFPGQNLTEKDVVMSYAGVRPLIDDGHDAEAKVSREHEIWKNNEGIVFMSGGKYTTFRVISEEIADFVFPNSAVAGHHSKDTLSTLDEYSKRLKGIQIWGKYTDEWFRWKLQHHMPCNLIDLIFRRSPIWMSGRSLLLNNDALEKVIQIAGDYFGWSNEQTQQERLNLFNHLKKNLNTVK